MKVRVEIGYENYVLEIEDAAKLVRILSEAEIFEQKWHTDTKTSSLHIYPRMQKTNRGFTMTTLSGDEYSMAKLAGKPEE